MLTSFRDLVEIAVLAVLVGIAGWTVWRLQRQREIRVHHRALVGLLSVGIGVGLCLLPQRSDGGGGRRAVGYPLPLLVVQPDGNKLPSPLGTGVAGLLNVVLVSGVIHGVAGLALAYSRRRGSGTATV